MRTLLLALTGCVLILSGPRACAESNGPLGPAGTSEYVFIAAQSTILQTGGIAGIHRTYTITGTFQLTVDSKAGTASFDRVDANATDDSSYKRTLDPNQVFNLTALTGRVVDTTTIRFEGKANNGSNVAITLTFADSTVALKGQTTPPPNSADFFVFALDAVAQRQDAYPVKTTEQFVLVGPESTILQTGGIAGVHWTYRVEGQFRLTVDLDTHTASFSQVDATATDDSPSKRTVDLNEVFNLTGLTGRVVDATTIRFEGQAADGSSVVITLTRAGDTITLKGETTPPPHSADFFVFTLDAVAQRKYAGGSGTADDPYQIATAADLIALGETPEDYDKHFIQAADIDLRPDLPGRKVFDQAVVAPATYDTVTSKFEGTPFRGEFDGNGHTISHLRVAGTSCLGLFGHLNGAEVRNVRLIDPNLDGSLYVGALAGWLEDGVITNCVIAGGSAAADGTVGGLVGCQSSGSVSNCSVADAQVAARNGVVGGLVGTQAGGNISDCSVRGGSISGTTVAGGLVGRGAWLEGTIIRCSIQDVQVQAYDPIRQLGFSGGVVGWAGKCTISDCRVTGGVVRGAGEVGGIIGSINGGRITGCYTATRIEANGGAQRYAPCLVVGGLAGLNLGTIEDCYTTSSVSQGEIIDDPDSHLLEGAGGVVGCNGGKIDRSYSTGAITGTKFVGGLVGDNTGGSVTGSFWDIQTSGQGASDGGKGMTTAEMRAAQTFLDAGWDFVGETANGKEEIWWMEEGEDYPRLAWERVLSDDFQDGKAEPLWMLYQPAPELVWFKEVNGRLEVEAIAQTENVDAIYAANGWRLDATKEFALRVDFHFDKRGTGDGRVTLGVTPSLDPSGMQWAELEAGCFEADPFFLYEVRDGSWVQERTTGRFANDGTLYISYNPDIDELYFSYTGYGKANAWQTVSGLLKGRWAGEPVYVILSGGSEGMALNAGDAWLDNFVLNAGVLAPNTSAQE